MTRSGLFLWAQLMLLFFASNKFIILKTDKKCIAEFDAKVVNLELINSKLMGKIRS